MREIFYEQQYQTQGAREEGSLSGDRIDSLEGIEVGSQALKCKDQHI